MKFLRHLEALKNSDGVVDGTDLAPLLADWGTSASGADVNQDGTVDGIDLAELLNSWGICSPWLFRGGLHDV